MSVAGLWRRGGAFALILLMVFISAAISSPMVGDDTPTQWQDTVYPPGTPYFTYDYVFFNDTLERDGTVHYWDVTVGINWLDETPRVVEAGMKPIYICPYYGVYHIGVSFNPSTFTLGIDETQTVEVAVWARENCESNNFIIQIEGYEVGVEDQSIDGFYTTADGQCRMNPMVLPEDSGCFIATAAYGTSTAQELDTLRAFRDEVLLESTLGSQLVEWYYQTSPPVADFISESSILRTIVRELVIDPLVGVVKIMQTLWRD